MENQKPTIVPRELDAILTRRYHGAVNIHGIRYQLLYSLLRAFELYASDDTAATIQLEGIEDLDLVGLRMRNEYVQVKTAQKSWNWSKLKEPISGFLEVARVDSECRFTLAVSFPLQGDIARIAHRSSLAAGVSRKVVVKFRNLCRQIGATAEEADQLLGRMTITSASEKTVWNRLRRVVADRFELSSEAVDAYAAVLIGTFLQWADERRQITRQDLERVQTDLGEALERESQFAAYGRALVTRIDWQSDASPDDFREGKKTRPGHVAAGLDVERRVWIDRIESALAATKTCVIRASSGQGKSTLLYRYAYEHWPRRDTFTLRVAEFTEQAELVNEFLRFRTEIGFPTSLIIDDAGAQNRHWPIVAKQCSALGIPVLVSIRAEDWFRFARTSLSAYEVIEPELDLDEARSIHQALCAAGRLHASVKSAEWAYERIGDSRVFIEYVYLLTHGQMLEERLREQIYQFSELQEDSSKVELLRRVSLAHAFGVPLCTRKLLESIASASDTQQLLLSLENEYVTIDDASVTGLHWVRSDHLVDILHEGHPLVEDTAIQALAAVRTQDLARFVANAVTRPEISRARFIEHLVRVTADVSMEAFVAFLDGLFEAGERSYFEANRHLFDEAYGKLGHAGVSLLSSESLPVGKLNTIEEMIALFGEKAGGFKQLQGIVARLESSPRGIAFCREFLDGAADRLDISMPNSDADNLGRLLTWCSLCKVELPEWASIRPKILNYAARLDLPVLDFCALTEGLFRYDEAALSEMFQGHRRDILSYLRFHTDCLELEVTENTVSISFVCQDAESGNQQAVSRFERLRSALPFCQRYRSKGIWILPFGLAPSIDDTCKDMPVANLPYRSDIDKNVIWRLTVETQYLPDSYYQYEEAWIEARRVALRFIKVLINGLLRVLVGRPFDFHRGLEGGELLSTLMAVLQKLPDPPRQTAESLQSLLKNDPKKWSTALQNFLNQLVQYLGDRTQQQVGELAAHNFVESIKYLPALHDAFEQLFAVAPDYFDATGLVGEELCEYRNLGDLLDPWLLNPPKTKQRDIVKYAALKRRERRDATLRRVRSAMAPLEEQGMHIIYPSDIHLTHPLRYMPLAFSVEDPTCYDEDVISIVTELESIKDLADFFCLVPTHRGARFLEGGLCLSSDVIEKLASGSDVNWESLVPRDLPVGVIEFLPQLPLVQLQRLDLRDRVIGLIGQLEAVESLSGKVNTIDMSLGRFDAALLERYERRISASEDDIRSAASQITVLLSSGIADTENSKGIDGLKAFLRTVQTVRFAELNIEAEVTAAATHLHDFTGGVADL